MYRELITNSAERQKFAKDLDVYLMKRYKSQESTIDGSLGVNISAGHEKFDFYFRFKPISHFWNPETLVIASIIFFDQRRSNGTSLLSFLVSVASEFNIKHIGIELAHTESMITFTKKYGFDNFNDLNWTISVEQLSKNMEK